MHGRKKSDFINRSEAEKEALRQKVANYKQLAFVALGNRRAGVDEGVTCLGFRIARRL
jgi:hypothetical protein